MNSKEFLHVIFDSIRDPFSIVDRDFKIIKANAAYARMRHLPLKNLIGKRCHEILQNRETVCEECVVEKTFRSSDPCAKEKLMALPDGLNLWLEIYTYPIFDEEGRVSHVIEYTRDITDRKKAEEEKKRLIEKLEVLSKTDSLTGLLNRRALVESLEYEIDRSKRYGAELSLIICDMDYFKEINDTYGHVAGDAALQVVSRAIRDSLRGTDLTGRYGGDEFMVILPETPFAGAKNFAERIRLSVKKADIAITENHNIKMSLSLGVTCFNAASDNLDLLVKRADSALYEAKKIGGNAVHALDCLPIIPAFD